MKKKFSANWLSSKKPNKQRKYLANAPLHLKKKFVGVHLSKDLRKKHNKRSLPVRKGDLVRVMRGKFKKKEGKILKVMLKRSRITIDGITIKKLDGSKKEVPIKASNLMIIELNLDDKKRLEGKKITTETKTVLEKESEKKTETKKKVDGKKSIIGDK
jgi:large subunit ribosomal protein L24